MNRPIKEQLVEMLRMQDQLNSQVEPRWLFANFAWTRAIRVEAAELTEHLGWKWWKKQEPNWPQAQLECVDIWHFMMSAMLVSAQGDHASAADEILANLEFPEREVMNLGGKSFTLAGLNLSEAVDILSVFAGLGYCFPALFERVMVGCGLSWGELRRQYVGKNVLNSFRNAHGYKEGTYEKTWHGEEDNVWLHRFLTEQPEATAEQLRQRLWEVYQLVPSAANQEPLPL